MSDSMNQDQDQGRDRIGFVRHGRPAFFDDPAVDKLLAITMALLGEVCVLRERLDAHERLAAARGAFSKADVDAYEPDEQARLERDAAREQAMARVLGVLTEEVLRLRHESAQK